MRDYEKIKQEWEKLYIDNSSYREEVNKYKSDKFKADAENNNLWEKIATLKDNQEMVE